MDGLGIMNVGKEVEEEKKRGGGLTSSDLR